MAKRKFSFRIERTGTIEVDDQVFAQITDEWRSTFYKLTNDAEIVEHLVFNLSQDRRLSELDGFANLDDALVLYRDDGPCERIDVVHASPKRSSKKGGT